MFCASVRSWHDSHFPGEWSGIKDQHNGLCQVSFLILLVLFWGLTQRRSEPVKSRTPDELKLQI